MITLNLHQIFKVKGIENPFTFLLNAGFPRHTAHLLIHNSKDSIRFGHIEKLCTLFNCELSDLFVWIPGKEISNAAAHPLYKLIQQDAVPDLKQALSTMTYTQLKEIAGNIQKQAQQNK